MAEELKIAEGASREEKYRVLLPQLKALLEDEDDLIANLANLSAGIHQTFEFLWVGFYRVLGEQLLLGPFQGPIACTRIRVSEGVCGAAVRDAQTILVPDVGAFPGHIACSNRSRSEIVVPLVQNGQVKLVLDIDSEHLDDFSDTDKLNLERVMELIDEKYPAPHPLMHSR